MKLAPQSEPSWAYQLQTLLYSLLLSSVLVAMLSFAISAHAQPNISQENNRESSGESKRDAAWRAEIAPGHLLGSGDLNWFGFHIYSAKLWSSASVFNVDSKFALELTYHKNISRERFVDTSLEEMTRLYGEQFSQAQLQRWKEYMQQAFTDVKKGDQLIGVNLPGIGCRFYNRDKLLAEIKDPAFARAFFGIWFDARSKDRKLRQNLLGAP